MGSINIRIAPMENNQISVDTFNKLAKQYQDKYMSLELYEQTFDCFIELLPKTDAKILDLGCGPGNIAQYLLKRLTDLKIFGIDLSPNMVQLAKTNNPQADFEVMDCRHIGELTESFDAIMCGFCLPYLSHQEVSKLINNASNLVSSGGVIYLSTMEDDYSKSGKQYSSAGDEVYIYFHQEKFLTQQLLSTGFEINQIQRKNFTEKDGSNTIDLFITAHLR